MWTPPAALIDAFDFIDGRFSAPSCPDGVREHRSPADRAHILAHVAHSRGQVELAVQAAVTANKRWAASAPMERENALRRYQGALRSRATLLAHTIAWEVGKPHWEARTEVAAMIGKVDLSLGPGAEYTRNTQLRDLPGEIRYRPLGVVAVIGPFNFPGHLPNGHVVPALLTGNCVVMKPSDKAPLTAQVMAQCFVDAGLPDGVFNVVQGGADSGAALACHPDVAGVLFTGSARAGRAVVAQSLDRLDRLVALELGGKNAAVALDDCDVERTARQVAFSAFVTAGQRCTATSRLVVTAAVAERLCERIVDLARNLNVGHPCDEKTFLGPVIDEESAQRLEQAVESAAAAGFTPLLPLRRMPRPPADGAYLTPSVHRQQGPLAADVLGYTDAELFGPDLAVYVVKNEEQAYDVVNRSRYGLSASVFCADRKAFERAASALRVGVIHFNRAGAGASGRLPFSGIKASGNHRPAGILTGLTCTYPQAVLLEQPHADPGQWPGFPPPGGDE